MSENTNPNIKCPICNNPAAIVPDFEEKYGPNVYCPVHHEFMTHVAPLNIESIMYQFLKKQEEERSRLKAHLIEEGYDFDDESYE